MTNAVVIALEIEFWAFGIGYLGLMCLTYYWFRHKYCDDKRIANKLMNFMWVFVVQYTVALLVFLAIYFLDEKYAVLVYQINLNVAKIFIVILPCSYILITHRRCFEVNDKALQAETRSSEPIRPKTLTNLRESESDCFRMQASDDVAF